MTLVELLLASTVVLAISSAAVDTPHLYRPRNSVSFWVFGPVWTALYLIMGIAAYLVWKKGLEAPGVKRHCGCF